MSNDIIRTVINSIHAEDNKLVALAHQIAPAFNKEPKNVNRSIRGLESTCGEPFWRLNFEPRD